MAPLENAVFLNNFIEKLMCVIGSLHFGFQVLMALLRCCCCCYY